MADRIKRLVLTDKSVALKKFLQFGIMLMIKWIDGQIKIQNDIKDDIMGKLKVINRKLSDLKVKLFFYRENMGQKRFHDLTKRI